MAKTSGFKRAAVSSRRAFCSSLLATTAGMTLADAPASARSDRHNILLITADDLGCQLGCYGDRTVPTPHLDSLYERGVRFDRAFVTQASCSPSRSSIFTGLYPHQNGQIGLSHRGFSMHPGQVTFPALLKQAGYTNGVVGKVHVQPVADVPFDFDTNPELRGWKTNNVQLVASYIKKFFARLRNGPFFLMVNFFDPHHPPEGKNNYIYDRINGLPKDPVGPDDVRPFPFLKRTTPAVLKNVPGYYNCVKRLDVGVGMLLDILKEQGHEEDTLVIFLGDHGPPFPGGKLTCYEAGLRVPFLIRWPARTRQRHACREMISSVDIMPTILEAAGLAVPPGIEGRSLLPLLEGRSVPWRKTLCGEFNWHTRSIFRPQRSIRDDRYKLIVTLDAAGNDTVQFFDLRHDPHEFTNLAGQPHVRAQQQRLMQRLSEWRTATKDPLLDRREIVRQKDQYYQKS